ncbi:MAG: T9SS type A sorting domain-containing protein [Bacteroidales bacterium]|nr:T9SS type A sorting domain-containing protein [Bacteroidales bacterium]
MYFCNYQAIVLPQVDVNMDPINALYLNFWARSSTRNDDPVLIVGVMTDPNDINTFQTVDSVFIDPAVRVWDRYEVSFESYNGNGQYIALRANRPSLADWTATIDDITISYEPMCRRVDNIRFRDVTPDSATVYWTRGGDEAEWELTIGDSVYYLTDTSYTLHGLESDTVYTVSIRAICGEGDTSSLWSNSFHTPCYLLGTLPLINDFENEPYYQLHSTSYVEAFPTCWRRVNDIPANNNTNGRPYIRNTGISGIHGNNSMYWELTTEYNKFFVVLPPVDKSVYNTRDLYLMFYARTLSNSEQPASYIIGVMDHDGDTANFVPVDTITATYAAALYTVSFANYSGTGNYIAIRSSLPSYGRELLLDDIVLTDHLCFPVSHLRASSTDTSVTLVWSPGASDSVSANDLSYTVVLGNDTVRGITDTFYTFHSLANTTLYNYAVATECPTLNSIFQTGSIQTECPPLTIDDIPYFEDFESYEYGYQNSISPCWRRGSVPATASSIPHATHLYIGEDTVGLVFSSSSHNYRWAALPRLDNSIDITQLELNFLIQRPGSGYSPIPSTHLIVGVAEDVTWYSGDLPAASMEITVPSYSYTYSGLVPVDTIDLSDEPVSSLHSISVRFENYNGSGRYIVFYTPSPESGMPNNGFYLDNITLRMAVTCPTVQNVRVTGTTSDSVFATWHGTTGADSWMVYIGEPGFEIGSVPPHVVNDTMARIGGLAPNTDYEMIVVASCGGSEGYPSYPEPFHTLCSPLTMLPFVEDFESVEGIPSYTTYANVNTLPECWLRHNTGWAGEYGGAPLVHNDSTYAHSGSKAMRFHTANISPECSDQYAIMPLTDPTLYPAGGLQVSFWLRTAHFYYNSFIVVGVMSDPTDTNSFVAMDTVRIESLGNYSHHTVRMAGYRGPHGHIAFKAPYQSPVNRPYIDDIVLEEMPCGPAENLQVVHTGLDSLTLSWTDTSSAHIFWHLEYDTSDFIPGTGAVTPIIITDTFYTMTGLDSGTVYHIYVYPDCFDSVVARNLVATTLLSTPSSIPYNGGFDSADSNGWVLINGTENNRWIVGDATGNPVGSLYITDDGSSNHYSGATSTVFATRIFNLDTPGEYAYSFDWKSNGEDNHDFLRAALVPAQTILTPGDYSGFDDDSAVPAGGIPLDGAHFLSQRTNWQTQCGSFVIDTPGNYIWVFMWHNDDNIYNQTPAAIDNVNLVPNDCPMPQNVVWELSADSLSLTWTPVGEENIWEVTLGDTSVIVTSPEYTFTNIPVSIIYTIHIRTICSSGDTSLAFTASIVNNRYVVTVTANNPSYGTVTGSGVYYNGDIATLSATPFTGYIFTQWSDGDITNPRSLFVTSDTTLIAVFQEEEGVGEIENTKLKIDIYPNPAKDITTISVTGISGKVNITILDLFGREMIRKTMECSGECEKSLDVKGLSDGTYFIRVTSDEIVPMVKKLIVR